MISRGAWLLLFAIWFWVDGDLVDPATVKNLLLPVGSAIVLLAVPNRFRLGIALLLGCAFFVWSFRRAVPLPTLEGEWFVATTALAFLLGASGARPPVILAVAAAGIAIAKGWDDLLFLRNVGGGIPFTATSFFVHKNFLTQLLSPALFLLLHLVTDSGARRWLRVFAGLAFVAGFLLLTMSEGRGALLGLGVGGAFLLVVVGLRQKLYRWGSALILLLLIASVAWGVRGRVAQAWHELQAISSAERVTTSVPERFRPWVWTGSIRLWQEAPWTGIGVGGYRHRIESSLDPWEDLLRDRKMKVDVAHSHWLQTLVERGIVGLLMEIAIAFAALVLALRSRLVFLAGAIVAMSVHALVGEGFEYPMGAVLWWYLLGAALSGSGFPSRIGTRVVGVITLVALAYPLWVQARTLQGEALIRVKDGRPTKEALEAAFEMAPGSPEVLVEVARFQSEAGDHAGALATLEHAHTLYPWRAATSIDLPLAQLWQLQGKSDSATRLLGDLQALYPHDPVILQAVAKQRKMHDGCSSAVWFIDSVRPRMDSLCLPVAIQKPSRIVGWKGVLARERAEGQKTSWATSFTVLQEQSCHTWKQLRQSHCQH